MKLIKPKFWDKDYLTIQSIILYPFTFIVDLRNFFYNFIQPKKYSKIKTICVGNIYLGGTGKTPLADFLASSLKKKFKTAIIKKKYPDHEDEKKLLEKNNKVFFENSRKISLIKAIKNKYELVIFDDGLQEKKIDYDVKIVCFNSLSLAGNQLRIPSGPLRERLQSLRKYDAVFIIGKNRDNNFKKKIKSINASIPIFYGQYICTNYKKFKKKGNIVFSGIGNPQSFINTLKKYSIKIKSNIIFPDHYYYTEADLKRIRRIAKKENLKILTTEKDFYRIPKNLRKNISYLKINLKINKFKEFSNYIENSL
tara:strand:- start:4461 stop:5390 length:930 start_codon:yes stop_codon:yes gene_type:complete